MSDALNPYVGPRAFEPGEAALFFGRDHEAGVLLSLIVAHPVVLLYSVSGAGKTSLLNTRVQGLLEQRGSKMLGPARVGGRLASSGENVYLKNVIMSLDSLMGTSEESRRRTLRETLAAVPLADVLGINTYRVLVLDQFEELFTLYPDRWRERDGFFEELGANLETDKRLRVVIAMREEYVASIEPYTSMLPERMRARFRLECLREPAALLAVEKPLERTERYYAPEAASTLVKMLLKAPATPATGSSEVTGEFVEPMQLQLVCRDLWAKLPQQVKEIDKERIGQLVDVGQALSNYYEYCIADVVKARCATEGDLRRWFDAALITERGTRSLVRRGHDYTHGLSNAAVVRLEKLRLLRSEERGGETWYELTHDRFIEPIRQSNRAWREGRAGAARMAFLSSLAAEWKREHKAPRALMSQTAAAEAREWLNTSEARELGVTPDLEEFVQASQVAAKQRRSVRKWRVGALALLAAAAVLASVAVASKRAQRRAEDATLMERGTVAKLLSAIPGKEFDALASGVRAVAPAVREGREVPVEADNGLRAAMVALGGDVWLRSSESSVYVAQFSPDDRHVLTASPNVVEIWDAVQSAPLYSKPVQAASEGRRGFVTYSPDGTSVIARLSPTQAGLNAWDAKSGKPIEPLERALKDDWFVAFSDSGTTLLAVSRDFRMRTRNPRTGAPRAELENAPKQIFALALSPEGERVACSAYGQGISLWHASSGKRIPLRREVRPFATPLLKFTTDGRYLVAADTRSFFAWDTANGQLVTMQQFGAAVMVPAGGSQMVLATNDMAEVWDLSRNQRVASRRQSRPQSSNRAVQALDRGGLLLIDTHAKNSTVTFWNPVTDETRTLASDLSLGPRTIDVSRDLGAVLYIDAFDRARLRRANVTPPAQLSALQLYKEACRRLRSQPEFAVVQTECQGVAVP